MNRLVRRQRAALALFIALTVSGVGVAMAGPQTGDQPGVTLDVSPNDGQGLADTQAVTVTGAGFPANTSVLVVQSAALPNGTTALSGTLATVTTSASGTFTTNVTVTRTFTAAGSGETIDCNATGVVCSVEAFTTSGNANSRHTISFASSGTTTPTTVTPTTVTPTTVTPTTVTPTTVTPTTVTPTTVTPTTMTPTTVTPTTVTPTTVTPTTVTPTTVTPTTVTPTTVTPTTVTPTTVTPTTVTPTTAGPTTSIVVPTTTPGGTLCDQVQAIRVRINAQFEAVEAAIRASLPAQEAATFLAQLEATQAQANALLNAICPAA